MSSTEPYQPGPARGARIQKEGERWTLVLARELRHPPATVWQAITDPEHLRAWSPFDADRSLGAVGPAKLTTVGAPAPNVADIQVRRAEAPVLLEYDWGGQDLRWQLEPHGDGGTRLTLWHNIHKLYIAMGAAGWHICLDIMDRHLAGQDLGRIVGPAAMQLGGWQRLHAEYAQQFGVQTPGWAAPPRG